MKNEKDISKGHGTTIPKRKTTAVAPGFGRMGGSSQRQGRRKQDRPDKPPAGPNCPVAHGFLSQRFLPLYTPGNLMPEDRDTGKGVINSLAVLSGKIGICPMDLSAYPYPYNVLLAQEDTAKQLRKKYPDLDLQVVEKENGEFRMATIETISRGYDLYYIPVRPLFRLLRSGKSKLAGKLLLAVFSYLYHVARVPGHRDEETFICYHTDMVKDWINDDSGWEEEDNQLLKDDIRLAAYEGDFVQKQFWHPYHLEHFAGTLANARPKSLLEKQVLMVAEGFLKLWQDHPEGNIFQNLYLEDSRSEDDEEYFDNALHAHEYIHFIHALDGSLYENIYGNIQTELNEKIYAELHGKRTLYEETVEDFPDSLNYPKRFFKLTDQLCDILINELK